METKERDNGSSGIPQQGKGTGEHIHQLLLLAESLTKTASHPAEQEEMGQQAWVPTPLGVDLGSLSDDETAQWAQTLEQLNRFLQGLMVQAAGEVADRVSAGRYDEAGARTPAEFLCTSLKLSQSEARNRIRLAQKFLPSTDGLTLAVTPVAEPVLGSAFFTGGASMEQALLITGFVEKAERLAKAGTINAHEVTELETVLSGYAETEPPYFLRHLGIRALALLDPDGENPSESQRLAKQGISFHRPYRGWVRIDGYLTISQYEQAMACIDWATNPKRREATTPNTDGDSSGGGQHTDAENREFGCDVEPGDPDPPPPASAPGPESPSGPSGSGQDGLLDLLLDGSTAGGFPSATGWDWQRRLTAEEIPPRPPEAPADAVPPSYEGESWFWIPEQPETEAGQGWDPKSSPEKNLFPPPGPPDPCLGAAALSSDGAHGDWSHDDEPGGPWPHFIHGVWVPAPGEEEKLPGLSPISSESTNPAVRDTRTRAQMLLDGMLHCLKIAASTDKFPLNGGLKPQLYLSLTQEELNQRHSNGQPSGSINTPYSGQVPLAIFNEELCDADVTELLLDSNGAILDVGRTQRLFTFQQRKILVARDMGCAFPDCTMPPQWTEAHHIIPWQDGGPTSIENGVLCCSLHHHYLHNRGWTVRLVGNTAWFTPPRSLDINQTERRNSYHHTP